MKEKIQNLIGKTIKNIEKPESDEVQGCYRQDDIYVITFTDGVVLKMASWDGEGYASGIDIEIK